MWDGEELGALPSVIGGGLLIGVVGGCSFEAFLALLRSQSGDLS